MLEKAVGSTLENGGIVLRPWPPGRDPQISEILRAWTLGGLCINLYFVTHKTNSTRLNFNLILRPCRKLRAQLVDLCLFSVWHSRVHYSTTRTSFATIFDAYESPIHRLSYAVPFMSIIVAVAEKSGDKVQGM